MTKPLVHILRRILLLSDGRDKILKIIQYVSKILLIHRALSVNSAKKANNLASSFSTGRKILRLAHFLDGIEELYTNKQSLFSFFSVLVGILNDVSDDFVCLAKIGFLDKKWSDKFTPVSDRLWYLSVYLDVWDCLDGLQSIRKKAEKDPAQQAAIKEKLRIQRVSLIKLLADYVFCSIDVFKLDWERTQVYAGLVAAVLGSYKLYVKHSNC